MRRPRRRAAPRNTSVVRAWPEGMLCEVGRAMSASATGGRSPPDDGLGPSEMPHPTSSPTGDQSGPPPSPPHARAAGRRRSSGPRAPASLPTRVSRPEEVAAPGRPPGDERVGDPAIPGRRARVGAGGGRQPDEDREQDRRRDERRRRFRAAPELPAPAPDRTPAGPGCLRARLTRSAPPRGAARS